jgi:cytochrome P450
MPELNRPEIPKEIANAAILPSSYLDEVDVHKAFTWIRNNEPLGIAQADGYDPLWFVSKLKDIRFIESKPAIFSSAQHNPILSDQANEEMLREATQGTYRSLQTLTFMDPPEHTGVRGISAGWFTPQKMKDLEESIRADARLSVDHLLSFDGECDFVKDFALHYPLRVVMTLLGVPREDEPFMLKLTQEFFGGNDPSEQREELLNDPLAAAKQWQAAVNDFYGYFNQLSADRRKSPKNDLLSQIANYQVDGEYLSDDLANGYYVAIATAGHDTTSSSVGGGMHALIENNEQFLLAQQSSADTSGLVAESVRWTSPVKHFMRVATQDTELNGVNILKGDRFFLSYPSANRDEDIFVDPFKFDASRKPNPHLGFGFGPHICLGQHLARFEMQILFQELLPTLKSIELSAPIERVKTNFVGGIKSMPVRFVKA